MIVIATKMNIHEHQAKEILKEGNIDIVDANAAKILIDNWFNRNSI